MVLGLPEGEGGARWSGVIGENWDNCNIIINKYQLKQKLKPKNQATGWEETICNTYT